MAVCLEGLLVLQSRTGQGSAASSAHVSPSRELRSHFRSHRGQEYRDSGCRTIETMKQGKLQSNC